MRKSIFLGLLISLSISVLAEETATQKGLYQYEVPTGYSRMQTGPGQLNYLAPRVDNYQSSVTIKSTPVNTLSSLKDIGDTIVRAWKESDPNTEYAQGRLVKINGNEAYLATCLYRLNPNVLTGQYHAFFMKDRQLVVISFAALAKDETLGKKFLESLKTFHWLP